MNDLERARSLIVDASFVFVAYYRGMTSPMDNRKQLLKEMKSKFGVGGTLVDGVLEIQGSFAVEAVEILKKKGYSKAKKIGK
jgi:translation initiation factor 1